jgi:hypothetical protein
MEWSFLAFARATARASAAWAFWLSSAWFHTSAMFTPRASSRFTAWDLRGGSDGHAPMKPTRKQRRDSAWRAV